MIFDLNGSGTESGMNGESFLQAEKTSGAEPDIQAAGKSAYYYDARLYNLGGVGHFFTTRYGGVSGARGNVFNASFGKEEPAHKDNVIENFRIAARDHGLSLSRFTALSQVHGDTVVNVTEEIAGARFGKPELVIEADSMITRLPFVPLMTTHGDCLPVFLYDKGRAVGMVHSGWRGTAADISGKTVGAMVREFGTDPGNVFAAIGPGICGECFEVDYPVARVFGERFPDVRAVKWDGARGKYLVDLRAVAVYSLVRAGVRRENISAPEICTACAENRELFFSYRAEKGMNEGLMGAVIWLEK